MSFSYTPFSPLQLNMDSSLPYECMLDDSIYFCRLHLKNDSEVDLLTMKKKTTTMARYRMHVPAFSGSVFLERTGNNNAFAALTHDGTHFHLVFYIF